MLYQRVLPCGDDHASRYNYTLPNDYSLSNNHPCPDNHSLPNNNALPNPSPNNRCSAMLNSCIALVLHAAGRCTPEGSGNINNASDGHACHAFSCWPCRRRWCHNLQARPQEHQPRSHLLAGAQCYGTWPHGVNEYLQQGLSEPPASALMRQVLYHASLHRDSDAQSEDGPTE